MRSPLWSGKVSECLIIARNWPVLRRGPIGKVENNFVYITPTPMFRWIITLNDRVPSAAKMFRRMPVGRVIATADMTTGAADAQMNPGRTDLQAFLAASRTWHDIADRTEMRASL